MVQVLRNVRWGVTWGLALAAGFSLYVLAVTVVRGSTKFEVHGLTTWSIIATYVACGAVAGAAVGALRPIARWWLGAMLVGAVAGVCGYGGISLAMDGRLDTTFALVIGIPMGGLLGLMIFKDRK